jgi:hypothetical protein
MRSKALAAAQISRRKDWGKNQKELRRYNATHSQAAHAPFRNSE